MAYKISNTKMVFIYVHIAYNNVMEASDNGYSCTIMSFGAHMKIID